MVTTRDASNQRLSSLLAMAITDPTFGQTFVEIQTHLELPELTPMQSVVSG